MSARRPFILGAAVGLTLVAVVVVALACSPSDELSEEERAEMSRAACLRRALAEENRYPAETLWSCVSADLSEAIDRVAEVNYERGVTDGKSDGRRDGYDSGWADGLWTYDYCSTGREQDSDYLCDVIACTFATYAHSTLEPPDYWRTPAPDQPTREECRALYSRRSY